MLKTCWNVLWQAIIRHYSNTFIEITYTVVEIIPACMPVRHYDKSWSYISCATVSSSATMLTYNGRYQISRYHVSFKHYGDVMMSTMASQITSLTIVCSTVYSGANPRKHQSSASLAFVWGIHRWPVNSPHKGPVTRNMFLFDDIIMK